MNTLTIHRFSTPSLLRAGGLAVLAAIAANIIARLLMGALVPLSPGFQPTSMGAIILFTAMFTITGVIVLALVNRFSAQPLKVFNLIGIAAFVVSILPNLAASANPASMPMGGQGMDYLALIPFHVIAALAFLITLNIAARKA